MRSTALLCLTVVLPAQQWTLLTQLPPRIYPAMAFDTARGETVLFGGSELACDHSYGDTWTRAGGAFVQRRPATTPPPRSKASMAYDSTRDRIVLFGGSDAASVSYYSLLGDTWEWDGTSWLQVHPAHSPSPRRQAGMVFDSGRNRCVMAGYDSTTSARETWEYDGVDWTQVMTPHVPPYLSPAMVYVPNRNRTVMMALDYSLPIAVYEYDGIDWTLMSPLQYPPPRYVESAALDPLGRVLIFGGNDGSTQHTDTWVYDGVTFVQQNPATTPSETDYDQLVFDASRQRTVLQTRTATWEFDGVDWHQVVPAAGFVRRSSARHTYDPRRDRIVQFGGFLNPNGTYQGHSDETWEWDGTGWNQVATAPRPPAGWNFQFVYDARRARCVLSGSDDLHVLNQFETWEYDGAAWVQKVTPHHPDHPMIAMSYDPVRGETIAFVGETPYPYQFVGTWRYDGTDWTEIPVVHSPNVRTGPAMAFDAALGATILYGGYDTSYQLYTDTWELRGSDWHQLNPQVRPQPAFAATCFDPVRGRLLLTTGLGLQTGLATQHEFDGTLWRPLPATEQPAIPGPFPLLFDAVGQRMLTVGPNGEVWRLDHAPAARFARYGEGCAGGPALDAAPGSLPALGSTFTLQVSGLSAQPGALYLAYGFDIARWQGAALPRELTAIGLPGCQLWLAPSHGDLVLHTGATTTRSLGIPNATALAGVHFAAQAFVLAATPTGLADATNAGIATID